MLSFTTKGVHILHSVNVAPFGKATKWHVIDQSVFETSRRELIDASVVILTSVDRGSIKVAKIGNHSVIGKSAIRRTFEGMNNSLGPFAAGNRTQLKNGTAAQAAFTRGSIKIATCIKNKITNRTIAV